VWKIRQLGIYFGGQFNTTGLIYRIVEPDFVMRGLGKPQPELFQRMAEDGLPYVYSDKVSRLGLKSGFNDAESTLWPLVAASVSGKCEEGYRAMIKRSNAPESVKPVTYDVLSHIWKTYPVRRELKTGPDGQSYDYVTFDPAKTTPDVSLSWHILRQQEEKMLMFTRAYLNNVHEHYRSMDSAPVTDELVDYGALDRKIVAESQSPERRKIAEQFDFEVPMPGRELESIEELMWMTSSNQKEKDQINLTIDQSKASEAEKAILKGFALYMWGKYPTKITGGLINELGQHFSYEHFDGANMSAALRDKKVIKPTYEENLMLNLIGICRMDFQPTYRNEVTGHKSDATADIAPRWWSDTHSILTMQACINVGGFDMDFMNRAASASIEPDGWEVGLPTLPVPVPIIEGIYRNLQNYNWLQIVTHAYDIDDDMDLPPLRVTCGLGPATFQSLTNAAKFAYLVPLVNSYDKGTAAGWAAHFIEDMCQPGHTGYIWKQHNNKARYHEQFETWVRDNWANSTWESGSIQSFVESDTERYYINPSMTPYANALRAAMGSHSYSYYVVYQMNAVPEGSWKNDPAMKSIAKIQAREAARYTRGEMYYLSHLT
jgi:hypothetical protein